MFPSYGGRYSGDFLIVRLKADGRLDSTFGTKGIKVLDLSGYTDSLVSIVALPGNGVLATGSTYQREEAGVVELNPNGRRNPTFGSNGFVGTGPELEFVPSKLLVQSDGRLILCGTQHRPFHRVMVIRYLPNGRIDASFHKTGMRVVGLGRADSFDGVCAVTPNEKLMVGGVVRHGYSGRSSVVGFERLFLQ